MIAGNIVDGLARDTTELSGLLFGGAFVAAAAAIGRLARGHALSGARWRDEIRALVEAAQTVEREALRQERARVARVRQDSAGG